MSGSALSVWGAIVSARKAKIRIRIEEARNAAGGQEEMRMQGKD